MMQDEGETMISQRTGTLQTMHTLETLANQD
jgi:hypothetical protein